MAEHEQALPESDGENGEDAVYHYKPSTAPTEPPKRVVSASPSMTETLFDLGFGERVVGVVGDSLFPAAGGGQKYKVGPGEGLYV